MQEQQRSTLPGFARGRLVGRRRELDDLARLLEGGTPLVTLVGPPGVGKTRLALETATRSFGSPPVWVSMRGYDALLDLVAAVAGLLGVSAASGDPTARVGQVLAGHAPLLLVLDDCEGVAEELGPVVQQWLDAAPGVQVLVTSRARLGVETEHVIEVGPLPIDDAVALLETRSRAARRDRRRQGIPEDVARRLVERLDCLPLAIELAASRMAVLPPQKLLERLDQRADEMLRAGAMGGADSRRPASLAAAIEASWRLLGPAERATLSQCAAFSGSFTLEAAEAVVLGCDVVEGALGSLHERSLIERIELDGLGGEVRFRPWTSVRAFALRQLEAAGEREQTEARVDAFVVRACEHLVDALTGPDALEMEQRLELERDQLVATHRRTIEHEPALGARAGLVLAELSSLRGVSGTDVHEATLRAAAASGDTALLIRSSVAFAVAGARLGATDGPRKVLDDAVAIAAEHDAGALHALTLFARGRFRAQRGAFDEADADLARAESLLVDRRDPHLAACVKNVQGCVAEIRGDFDAAVRAFEAARVTFRLAGSERMEAAVLNNLGVVREAEGRREDSRRLYEAALERSTRSGNRTIEADTRMNLGSWHLGVGELERADEYLRQALVLQRRLGNRRFEGLTLGNLAILAHARGELRAARDLYQEGLATLRECGEARFVAMTLPFAAAAEASLGLLHEARADFEAARRAPPGMAPSFSIVVDTLEAFLILAEARGAEPHLREVAERRAAERLELARAAQARTGAAGELGSALRLLSKALATSHSPPSQEPSAQTGASGTLVVGAGQRWFVLADGERVDLSRRGPLRLILRALAEHRQDAPGMGVASSDLFAAGWPGQRALPHAAANRVYSAIATLRRLGLDSVIARNDDGYLIEPTIMVERRSS
ncbi:MAG: tetratricopeptide repeat protein [Polyangiaceae bacterium]|nr:tetratricopeptide repeat protein [Polyangiaceae bacterium]